MTSEEFRRFGYEAVDWIAHYVDHIRDYPVELGPVEPGQYYLLPVAVCGHGDGEQDTEVEVRLDLLVDDDPEPYTLTVTYTPVRPDDT